MTQEDSVRKGMDCVPNKKRKKTVGIHNDRIPEKHTTKIDDSVLRS